MSSCSSDEEITDADANTELVKEATNYLNGEIVLSTNATMNGVNKTLLPEGCPTKFKFEWSKTDAQTFTISLLDFTVGNMGMIINLSVMSRPWFSTLGSRKNIQVMVG